MRNNKFFITILIISLLTFFAVPQAAFAANGDSVAAAESDNGIIPISVEGNDNNQNDFLNDIVDGLDKFKLESGDFGPDLPLGVEIDWTDEDGYFSWNLTQGDDTNYVVSYVFIKSSDGGFLYEYIGSDLNEDSSLIGSFNDQDIVQDISHVSFYLDIQVPEDTDPGAVTISKTFSDGNLAEVEFQLWQDEEQIRNGITSGQAITFEELEPGTYELVEADAPEGYDMTIIGGELINVEADTTTEVEVLNRLIEEVQFGSITVLKTFNDENTTEVAFQLWQTDELIDSGTTSGQAITFEDLLAGTYTLIESDGPSGYEVSIVGGDTITLEEGKNIDVSVVNTKIIDNEEDREGSLTIIKNVPNVANSEVEFEFSIYEGDALVTTVTASELESATLNLDAGTYTIIESAASGYSTDDAEQSAVVVSEENTQVNFVNTRNSSGGGGGNGGSNNNDDEVTVTEPVIIIEPEVPASPVTVEVPVLEEAVPGAPVLPQTGGLDSLFLLGLGTLLTSGGLILKRTIK